MNVWVSRGQKVTGISRNLKSNIFHKKCIPLLDFTANKCPIMISVFSLYTWDVFGKVVSGLLGYYSGNVDVIPSRNLLIIAKV